MKIGYCTSTLSDCVLGIYGSPPRLTISSCFLRSSFYFICIKAQVLVAEAITRTLISLPWTAYSLYL
jgi:hypothetical protein